MSLSKRLLPRLSAAGMKVLSQDKDIIEISFKGLQASVNLANLRKMIEDSPEREEQILQSFTLHVEQTFQSKTTHSSKVYLPRIIPLVDKKPMSAPWSQLAVWKYSSTVS